MRDHQKQIFGASQARAHHAPSSRDASLLGFELMCPILKNRFSVLASTCASRAIQPRRVPAWF